MKLPRISLRALLILVALAGLYFGCWELTKRHATPAIESVSDGRFTFDSVPAPFVVRGTEWRSEDGENVFYASKYLWFFGATKCVYLYELSRE